MFYESENTIEEKNNDAIDPVVLQTADSDDDNDTETDEEKEESYARESSSYGDVIAAYLRDIGNQPLLTREEEVELSTELNRCKEDVADYVRAILLKADDALGLSDIEISEDTKQHVRNALCGRRADRPIDAYVAEVGRLRRLEAGKQVDDLKHRILGNLKDTQIDSVIEKVECAARVARKSTRILGKKAARAAGKADSAARKALQEKRMQKAKAALTEVTNCLGLSADDLQRIHATIVDRRQRMDAARKRLVEANLRLVIAIAKRFKYRGVNFGDLIQEGNVALMRAVEGFDPGRGFAFATFAGAVIRRRLGRVILAETSAVHIPSHVHETERKVKLAAWYLSGEAGERATQEEIAEFLECPLAKVTDALSAVHDPVRLDKSIGDGSEVFADLLTESNAVEPADALAIHDQERMADSSIERLDDRERTILALRYNSKTDYDCTLEEVGNELGVTRERVRQLESRALRKLRINDSRSS